MFEEFMLLRDFEKTENELESKLVKKKEEFTDVMMKTNEIIQRIDAKRKEIEKLDEQQKQLTEKFHIMVKEETKYNDFLFKVYKRKIKRKKKVDGAEDEGK
jgi:cilia- and flagella-associated protein 44